MERIDYMHASKGSNMPYLLCLSNKRVASLQTSNCERINNNIHIHQSTQFQSLFEYIVNLRNESPDSFTFITKRVCVIYDIHVRGADSDIPRCHLRFQYRYYVYWLRQQVASAPTCDQPFYLSWLCLHSAYLCMCLKWGNIIITVGYKTQMDKCLYPRQIVRISIDLDLTNCWKVLLFLRAT